MSRGTTLRAVRVPDELWHAALAQAEREGVTVSAVIRKALEDFIRGSGPTAPLD